MSRYTSNQSGGNDGTWFLDAIGQVKAPTASEVVAGLEAENTIVDDPDIAIDIDTHADKPADVLVAHTSFDGSPGTSTSSFDPVPPPPPPPTDLTEDLDPIGGDLLIEASPGEIPDAEDTVDDTELSPALRSKRTFRWPVVVALVLSIALVVAAAIMLPARVEDQAREVRQNYFDAAFGVRDFLPEAQVALDAITNPSSSDTQVAGAVPAIAELDTRAFALETATTEPLPATLPLVPSGPIDELEPLKDTGAILGAAASDLTRRLANSYVYRTSIPLLLDTGPLPIAATTPEINEISVRLATSLAADASIVADLPDDPAFAEVKTAATDAVSGAADWQDAYLGALSGEETDAAAALVADMATTRNELRVLSSDALVAFRTEADLIIVDLAGELDAYIVAVSAG